MSLIQADVREGKAHKLWTEYKASFSECKKSVCHGTARHGTVCYGMVWYGMVRYDMIYDNYRIGQDRIG